MRSGCGRAWIRHGLCLHFQEPASRLKGNIESEARQAVLHSPLLRAPRAPVVPPPLADVTGLFPEPPEGLEERTRRRRPRSWGKRVVERGRSHREDLAPIFPPAILRSLPHLLRLISERAQFFQSVRLPVEGPRPSATQA